MFSIIIVVISITLVALLAAATIYYGGDSFNKGNSKARAAEILNQAEMIKGAFTAYKVTEGEIEVSEAECDAINGMFDGCLNPLIDKQYLTDIPQGQEGWYIDSAKTLRRTLGTDLKACAVANFLNGAGVPQNPDQKSLDLEGMKTSDLTQFRQYIPECSSITTASSYICCEN